MFMRFFSADAKIFLLNLKENLSPKTYIKMPSKVAKTLYRTQLLILSLTPNERPTAGLCNM